MIWWQWVVLGIVLLGAELMVDAQFYLVFLGASALAVGLIDFFWADSPLWVEWLLFSIISVAALLLFRAKVYRALRGFEPDRGQGVVGEMGVVLEDIEPGGSGKIELRGTTWTARNVGEHALPRDTQARVDAVSGLVVDVIADED